MFSVVGWVSTPVTELAIVICRPSRIHAAPKPATMRVWNGDQPSRSRRAGIVERIGDFAAATVSIGVLPSLSPTTGGRRDASLVRFCSRLDHATQAEASPQMDEN